jgi:O-antigen ligase
MLLTKSRTGNASTLTAIAAVFLVQAPLKLKLTAGFAALWMGLAGLWLLMVVGYDPLTDFQGALLLGRAEESDTLSGRAFIWPLVTYFIGQRPWLGYGFESFWNASNIELVSEELTWGVREAHNGYLDILLSTGIVGLTLAVLAVLAGLTVAARSSIRRRNPAYALPLGMLVFGLLSSWMESGMVNVMLPPLLVGCCLLRMALFERPVGRMSETKCTLCDTDDAREVHFATAHAPYRSRT